MTGFVEALSSKEQIELLYLGYFQRAGDGVGFRYWTDEYNRNFQEYNSTGVVLTQMANEFAPQKETLTLYPFLGSGFDAGNENDIANLKIFIENVYNNLFDRAPDEVGATYWANQIADGAISVGAAILAIANGAGAGADAQTQADAAMLKQKIKIAVGVTDASWKLGPFDVSETGSPGPEDITHINETKSYFYTGHGGLDSYYSGSGDDYLWESGIGHDGWHVGDEQGPTPGVNAANLDSGGGDDFLGVDHQATGSFMLIGGFGDDQFYIGGGTNVLISGDDGKDTYYFSEDFSGVAEIRSFQQGLDVLNFDAGGSWALDSDKGGVTASFTNRAGGHLIVDGIAGDTMFMMRHGTSWY